MPAKGTVKCPYCGKYFDRDSVPYIQIGRRYAHKTCYDAQSEEIVKQDQDKELFYEYIKRIYGPKYNYMMINKQAESYIKEHGYTWGGMAGTLHWFYDIKKGSVEDGHGGVGIIPFVYDQAKEYYITLNTAEQENRKIKNVREPVYFNIQSPRAWVQPPHLLDMED